MVYNYEYFTGKTDDEKSILDKLGDWLFSLADANSAKGIGDSHKKVMMSLIGGFPEDNKYRHIYKISSPAYLLSPEVPPTMLIQGSHDSMAPIEPTRAMYNKLKSLGVHAAFLELPNTDHAFDVIMPEGSVITEKVINSILIFLESI